MEKRTGLHLEALMVKTQVARRTFREEEAEEAADVQDDGVPGVFVIGMRRDSADSAMYPGWPQGADLTGELMKVLHVPGSD
ncbi:hypothetical protein C0Q70_06421 [Pomacea canaliculata]|uniref:Uncharacterized protein n=1 Tax=Pomacea canaliculata TaxID=400727 RepID=A0A2T7PP05_POMCA|nr:hypothetical protein C0Q70_06421 [Pomacea canaliculata]